MLGRASRAARCGSAPAPGGASAARCGVESPSGPPPRGSPARRPRAPRRRSARPSGTCGDRLSYALAGRCSSMRALILGAAAAAGCWGSPRRPPPPARSAPTCAPATLDNSALQDGSVTVSPLPGSRDASPQTQISFLGVPARRAERDQRRRLAHGRARGAPGRLLAGRRRELPAVAAVRRRRARDGARATARGRLHADAPRPVRGRTARTRSAPRRRAIHPGSARARSRASARARTCTRRWSR